MAAPYLSVVPPVEEEPEDLSFLVPPEQELALGFGEEDDYTEQPALPIEEIKNIVDDLMADHSFRIANAKEYSHFLDTNKPGYFKEDEELIADDIIETLPLMGARDEHEFRVGYYASHAPYPKLLNRDALDRDEAMIVEDAVIFDFQCEERQYEAATGSDLRIAEVEHILRFGMLAGVDALNPDDPYCGLSMQLFDPLTVFPVWGGEAGLLECFRVYEAPSEVIIGAYGGKYGSEEYRRIESKVKKGAEKRKVNNRDYMTRGQNRTVIERWGTDYLQVIIDEDEELLERKHGYRFCPVTVTIGAFDAPAGVSIGTNQDPEEIETFWGSVWVSDASIDLARQLRPFAWRHIWAHRIAEAVAGRQLSIFKWAIDPHKIVEVDPSTDWKMGESIDLIPGEQTTIPIPNKVNLVTPVIDPMVMEGVAANLQANVGSGMLTQLRMGAIPPQTSGSALGKLLDMGGAGDVKPLKALTRFKKARAERRLELRANFGDALGKNGVMPIPASQPEYSKTAMHELTPQILKNTGHYLDLDMHYFTPDLAMAQYLTTVRAPSPITGKPMVSDATARRALKAVPDPDREEDRIDDEALGAMPPVQQQRHLRRIERDIDKAMEMGDQETAEDLMVASVELQFLHDMAIASGQAAPNPNPAGGTTPQMTQPAAPAPTPAMPGTSLTELGIGVGQEGGAPPGANTGATGSPLTPATSTGTTGQGL